MQDLLVFRIFFVFALFLPIACKNCIFFPAEWQSVHFIFPFPAINYISPLAIFSAFCSYMAVRNGPFSARKQSQTTRHKKASKFRNKYRSFSYCLSRPTACWNIEQIEWTDYRYTYLASPSQNQSHLNMPHNFNHRKSADLPQFFKQKKLWYAKNLIQARSDSIVWIKTM